MGNVTITKAQQPFGIPIYSNCYQRVEGGIQGGTQNFKFLNTTSGRKVTMSSTNPLDIDVFEVYGREYDVSGFQLIASGDGELFVPTIFESILIVPIGTSTAINYATTQIDFVDFDFQINSNTGTPPCLTFDNLNINLTHNLDGLCQNPLITLKMPPGSVQTYGLGSNYSKQLNEDYNYQIPIQDFCNPISNGSVHICQDAAGREIGCCFTFDFEITLYPCIGRSVELCPPIKFTKQYPVCCFCGSIPIPD